MDHAAADLVTLEATPADCSASKSSIVKTVALEPTFVSLGVLAGLVLVRTFLSWTLVLEIEGQWPWRVSRGDRSPPET